MWYLQREAQLKIGTQLLTQCFSRSHGAGWRFKARGWYLMLHAYHRLLHEQMDQLTNKRTMLMYAMLGLFGVFLLASYMLTYRAHPEIDSDTPGPHCCHRLRQS